MAENIFINGYFDTVSYYFGVVFETVIQCSKYSISTEIEAIEPFPKITQLRNEPSNMNYDQNILVKIQKEFDSINNSKKISWLAKEITLGIKSTDNKGGLRKKRKDQKRILKHALKTFREKCKKEPAELNSFKIYSTTINSYYLSYPPRKISKNIFEQILLKAKNDNDRKKLNEIYKLVEQSYCAQRRLTKTNYKNIARIIFNIKYT